MSTRSHDNIFQTMHTEPEQTQCKDNSGDSLALSGYYCPYMGTVHGKKGMPGIQQAILALVPFGRFSIYVYTYVRLTDQTEHYVQTSQQLFIHCLP